MAGKDGVNHFGYDRVVVSDQAGQDRLLVLDLAAEVSAHFFLDGDGPVASGAKLADSVRTDHPGGLRIGADTPILAGGRDSKINGNLACHQKNYLEDFACLDALKQDRYEENTSDPPGSVVACMSRGLKTPEVLIWQE